MQTKTCPVYPSSYPDITLSGQDKTTSGITTVIRDVREVFTTQRKQNSKDISFEVTKGKPEYIFIEGEASNLLVTLLRRSTSHTNKVTI